MLAFFILYLGGFFDACFFWAPTRLIARCQKFVLVSNRPLGFFETHPEHFSVAPA
jgi:hypothetical protein